LEKLVMSKLDTASLLYWIAERENIRRRRAEGAPPPWTVDPVLQKFSFCNVRREDDRVTRWIAANWREPHTTDPDLWFAMSVSRFVNWPDTMAELGYPVPWRREHFIALLQDRAAREEKVWGDAYNISNGGQSVPKAQHVASVLDKLWQAHNTLRPRPGERLAEWHGRLVPRDGIASFMAAQIVADMKYVEPLRRANDWMTFAASGPGSKRGLNRVLGRPVKNSWDEYGWRVRLKELHKNITPELERIGLGDLHAQDLQNCLCELDEYLREKSGEGHPKRRFVPK
jgi:alpha-glutamyl/putrescinyl thymine pyrophosphorylase clade 1